MVTRKLIVVLVFATLAVIGLTGCHFHVSAHASPGDTPSYSDTSGTTAPTGIRADAGEGLP